jgi:hypothetical protein
MLLLEQIQRDIWNPNIKVSDLLRKLQTLAYRLGNKDLKNWIECELNDYAKDEDQLPEYRIIKNVSSIGHFIGPYGKQAINVNIPLYCLPVKEIAHLSKMILYENVATLESHIRKNELIYEEWDNSILAIYGQDIFQGMFCISARKRVDIALIEGIIDKIKTKISKFILEIELLNPQAGEAVLNSNPIPQDRISQIFNINISGNVQNLASGSYQSTIDQSISNNIPRDFLELLSKLKSSDIDEEIASEVADKIENLSVLVGTSEYKNAYIELMNIASSHVTVFAFLAPYIAMLTSYLN